LQRLSAPDKRSAQHSFTLFYSVPPQQSVKARPSAAQLGLLGADARTVPIVVMHNRITRRPPVIETAHRRRADLPDNQSRSV
jgi:hypothetical protein